MSVINRTAGLVKEFGISVTVPKLFQTCTKRIPVIKDIAGKLKYNAITGFLYEENKDILENYNTIFKNKQTGSRTTCCPLKYVTVY